MSHKYFGNILEGKRAIITGSNRGLGLLMARRFLECGAKVAVLSAPFEEIDGTVEQLKALDSSYEVLGYRPELINEAEVSAMLQDIVEHWGGIDILVNNAGIYPTRPFEQYPQDLFQNVFQVNVEGIFVMTQQVVKFMKNNENGGAIVNTSSMAGIDGAMANIGYTASKHAVEGLTQGLARELGKYKIRVNGVAPAGMQATDINGDPVMPSATSMTGYDPEKMAVAYQTALKFAPLGGFQAHPDEMINAFIFLASDAASFISGQTIAVSGACIWPAASPASCM